MSEFKFACPMCGQHIRCGSDKSGKQVDCPTCFQKLSVPDAPQGDASKLVLNASLAEAKRFKPHETTSHTSITTGSGASRFPWTTVALVVLLCVAASAVIFFRGRLFHNPSRTPVASEPTNTSPFQVAATVNDTNWTLNLMSVEFPDSPVTGRIGGRAFTLHRALLRGGTLELRQGDRAPDMGFTINFFAKRSEELARQSIAIEADRTNSPKVTLRIRDNPQQAIAQTFFHGYALRLDFGQLTNGHLPGKIYFCSPDPAKSWLAGTFTADIRKPGPSKPRLRP